MLDRLTDIFCEIDDYCNAFFPQRAARQPSEGKSWERGPECRLSKSEIMTIVVLYHGSRYQYFKNFYEGVALVFLKRYFPGLPSYDRFIALRPRVFRTAANVLRQPAQGIRPASITRTPPRCPYATTGAVRGKTSMGWCFGFKLHLVFNHLNDIVAVKLTPSKFSDAAPVASLVKGLTGKLFGDQGYIVKKLADPLLRQGFALMTRARKNMKSLPMTLADQALLDARNMVETIIEHIKTFSSFNLARHRSPINAFIHLIAALTAYQLNPIYTQHHMKITAS